MNKRNVLFILFAVSTVICCGFPFALSYRYTDDWKKDTTPLPRETIVALCEKFSLSNQDPLCDGSKDIYAADFSEVLREKFPLSDPYQTPKNEATITYQEVDAILGEYKWECQDVVNFPASGYSSFRCFYDLRGDRYWRYVFYFYYPEETLYSIRSGSSKDD